MPWASAVLGTHNEPTFSLFLGRLTLHRGSWCWDSRAASFLRWARGRPEPGPGRPTKGEASATCSHWRRWDGGHGWVASLQNASAGHGHSHHHHIPDWCWTLGLVSMMDTHSVGGRDEHSVL